MHYDHISFHTEENYPADLPHTNAAHHIGYYFAWAVSQNLHSQAAAALPDFAALQNGSISGAEFILGSLNGGIDDTCFNDLGNRFTAFYYADEDEGYGRFMEDYFTALDLQTEADLYRVADKPEHRQTLNRVFQAAFEKWILSLKKDS